LKTGNSIIRYIGIDIVQFSDIDSVTNKSKNIDIIQYYYLSGFYINIILLIYIAKKKFW